jgi:phosphoribosylanthranilate isomerase
MHLRVKICGITSAADARQAAWLGADAVGLNFYPRSRRYITADTTAEILRALPPLLEAVALYVNAPLAEAFAHAQRLGLATVQWHGDAPEPPPDLPRRFIPAFSVSDAEGLRRVSRYLEHCREVGRLPAAVLVDGAMPGEYGGTGQAAAWDLLAGFDPGMPLILAGGLTPDNVAEAVRLVRPYAVDVAGGVEAAPGRKDAEKMRRFIESARAAAARL